MNKVKLSVIIPAYNEAKNLQKGSLDQVNDYLSRQEYSYEVLIIDDGSIDSSAETITNQIKNKKGFTLLKNPHGGKAVTVMTGLLASNGEIAVFTDMDQATPLKEIEKFFPKFEEGFDTVIGVRQGRKGAPFVRKLSAWGFSFLRNLILGLPFPDTQCGFKAFKRDAIGVIFTKLLEDWKNVKASGGAVNAGFDVEMLFFAKKKNLKIAEVPVEWFYVDTQRVQIIKDAIEAMSWLLKIRLRSLKGFYD